MCTVTVMWLAGIPVADKAVLHLAASLRDADLVGTAERLEHAYDRDARIVALDIPDREAICVSLRTAPRSWRRCCGSTSGATRRALTAPEAA